MNTPSVKKIKIATLCSGYDSQILALKRLKCNFLDFDYDLVAWSEIDKYAIKAHDVLFPQYSNRNLGDMTKIDWRLVDDFDFLFYSTPCQSISSAGLQHGFAEGSGTLSSIIWNVREAVIEKRQKYLCLENVKGMIGRKFLPMFNLWQNELARLGYVNFAKILNATDYGVPQHRERIFLVSIRMDDNVYPHYFFPKAFKLEKRLNDILEENVDEKYYLLEDRLKELFYSTNKGKKRGNGYAFNPRTRNEISFSISTKCGSRKTDTFIKEPFVEKVGNINHSGCGINGNVYSENEIAPTLTTNKGEGLKILSYSRDKKGDVISRHCKDISNTLHSSNFSTTRQYVIGPTICQRGHGFVENSEKDLCPTITGNTWNYNNLLIFNYKVRRLTPRECFRLMDVSEDDINKLLRSGISNSQLYKLAGNSIVVSCLYYIFYKLFINTRNESRQLTLF